MALPFIVGALIAADAASRSSTRKKRRQDAQQAQGRQIQGLLEGAGFGNQIGPRVGVDPQVQQQLGGIAQTLAGPDTQLRQAGITQLQDLQKAQGINTPAQVLYDRGKAEEKANQEFQFSVIQEEQDLNKQFRAQTAGFREGLVALDMARASLGMDNPNARLNVARLAIQQLDKSMITNPEIANILQQQGLAGQWSNFVDWVDGDGKITKPLAAELLNAMTAIASVMDEQLKAITDQTRQLVDTQYTSRGIPVNIDNVLTMVGDTEFDLSPVPVPGSGGNTTTTTTQPRADRDPVTGLPLSPNGLPMRKVDN